MSTLKTQCPTDAALSDFALGKLDVASGETVTRHLETCADCQRRVASISDDSFVGRLRQAGKPAPRGERTYVPGESLANAANSTDGSLEDGLARPSRNVAGQGKRDGLGSPSSVSAPPELANHPDYELIKQLGQGGMGTVYLAKNRMMDRMEVLKVISKSLLDRPGALERFQQEIRSAAKLQHPNIVAAYSVLRPGDLLVFAMEYVKGHDLSQVVTARGYLPVANAAFYIHQVANGLQHAHEKGMVHRDIKPNNLMLAIEGKKHVVKILDFGLAKATSEKGAESGLTKSGQMLGTPDYIAPEQTLDAHKADIRADIYSLGCTLYFLLSGGPPFQESSLYAILQAHHKRDPQPLNLLRPEVPVELAAVVAKMMAKDPAKRFQTPGEVAKALVPFFKPGQALATTPVADSSLMSLPGEAHPGLGAATPVAPMTAPRTPFPASVAVASPMPLVTSEQADLLRVSVDTHRPAKKRRIDWRSLPPWQRWTAFVAAVTAVLLGVVLLIRTPKGTIKFELSDRSAAVELTVDGDRIDIAGRDGPLSLQVGEHRFKVVGKGFETVTDQFTVTRGANEPIRIELVPSEPARPPDSDGVTTFFGGDDRRPPLVPLDAQEFGGHWYKFYQERVSWKAARDRCEALGGHLVIIDSLAENAFVGRLVEKVAWQDAWIGATDEAEEGRWRDVNGELLHFSNWMPGQPNDKNAGEHYALMTNRTIIGWLWCDQPNESKQHQPGFVCEWETATTTSLSPPAADAAAPATPSKAATATNSATAARLAEPGANGLTGAPALAVAPFDTQQARAHQEAWAKHLGVSVAQTNSVGMKLTLIPPGEFAMGSTAQEIDAVCQATPNWANRGNKGWFKNEAPSHHVTLASAYYLGTSEVTQKEWLQVLGTNPSYFSATGNGKEALKGEYPGNYPVETVSWFDAIDFCNHLSEREGLPLYYHRLGESVELIGGRGYRLPTEAEWEYACRAGTSTGWSFGDDQGVLGQYAWIKANKNEKTRATGRLRANPFGLYDVHGNVWEWCWDWFGPYSGEAVTDPFGPSSGTHRIVRGGAYCFTPAALCRSATRNPDGANNRGPNYGFRIARTVDALDNMLTGDNPDARQNVPSSADEQAGGTPSSGGVSNDAVAPPGPIPDASAPASAPSSTTALAPPPEPAKQNEEQWLQLFNGKDLSGWKTHPRQPGNWRVEKGALLGSGTKISHLYSERGDFANFHLRGTARVGKDGDSGVYVRASYGPTWGLTKKSRPFPAGYAAQIYGVGPSKYKTGSLLAPGEWLVQRAKSIEQPNKWFTLEFIAEGNHLVVKVEGQQTADYTDDKRRYSKGYIALQQNANTGIQFRKIEIKELP